MPHPYLTRLRPERFPSPCYVTDLARLRANAAILNQVQQRTDAKILLALKAFSQWRIFPTLSRAQHGPLHGCCASSPDEARLAREHFGGEVHAFAAAYSEDDMIQLLETVDHLVFNSLAQWRKFAPMVAAHNRHAVRQVECGLRINPEHSEGATPMYDPCAPGSRLGIRARDLDPAALQGMSAAEGGITGLHFHTLCEQGADALARTLEVVEATFGSYLGQLRWLNMGGGHHITRAGYDLDLLCRCIERVQNRYEVAVYLEPGEAVALDAGVLITTVLDVVHADMPVAILDCSATCHMPDVLEMPYRPGLLDAGLPGEKPWTYRLAGKSCLAGDVVGEYSFDAPLQSGMRLVFTDMAIYTMVKTSTFNGLRLPCIAVWDGEEDSITSVRNFGYEDFLNRLS